MLDNPLRDLNCAHNLGKDGRGPLIMCPLTIEGEIQRQREAFKFDISVHIDTSVNVMRLAGAYGVSFAGSSVYSPMPGRAISSLRRRVFSFDRVSRLRTTGRRRPLPHLCAGSTHGVLRLDRLTTRAGADNFPYGLPHYSHPHIARPVPAGPETLARPFASESAGGIGLPT